MQPLTCLWGIPNCFGAAVSCSESVPFRFLEILSVFFIFFFPNSQLLSAILCVHREHNALLVRMWSERKNPSHKILRCPNLLFNSSNISELIKWINEFIEYLNCERRVLDACSVHCSCGHAECHTHDINYDEPKRNKITHANIKRFLIAKNVFTAIRHDGTNN